MSNIKKYIDFAFWLGSDYRLKDLMRLSYQEVRSKGPVKGLKYLSQVYRYHFQERSFGNIVFSPERFRNMEQYRDYLLNNAMVLEQRRKYEESFCASGFETFTIHGYSYPARCEVDFLVDYLYSNHKQINWRERLICPITLLNNRLRATLHLIDAELQPTAQQEIYIAEQLTPLYQFLKRKFPRLTGSEYLGPSAKPGSVSNDGIRHEDATQLSFQDNSLDLYLTFECLEHIPDFGKAFAEAYRVLKPGGKLFWTVPFADQSAANIIRATMEPDGTISHLMEPEYHGDPVHADKGILCYQHFGWEMLTSLIKMGFQDAYAISFWSKEYGYLGEQFVFCAVK